MPKTLDVHPTETTTTGQIRVVSAVRPQLLRDMLSELMQREDDISVVAEVDMHAHILPAVQRTGANVVLLPMEDHEELAPIYVDLLKEAPDLLVIGVTVDSKSGCAWYCRIERVRLEEISPDTILSAIRAEFRAPI